MPKEIPLYIILANCLIVNCLFFGKFWSHSTARIKKEDLWQTCTPKVKQSNNKLPVLKLLKRSYFFTALKIKTNEAPNENQRSTTSNPTRREPSSKSASTSSKNGTSTTAKSTASSISNWWYNSGSRTVRSSTPMGPKSSSFRNTVANSSARASTTNGVRVTSTTINCTSTVLTGTPSASTNTGTSTAPSSIPSTKWSCGTSTTPYSTPACANTSNCTCEENEATEKGSMFGRFLVNAADSLTKMWHYAFEDDRRPQDDIAFYLFTRFNPLIPENLTVKQDFVEQSIKNIELRNVRKRENKYSNFSRMAQSNDAISKIFIPLDPINGEKQSQCFNILAPTKILIHGYTQSCTDERIMKIKDAYLKKGSYNVIMVEWGKLAVGPCYWTATKNTRTVGRHLGHLLQQMSVTGAMMGTFHVVGFSLGAQVAGLIKQALVHASVSRITGLDPALPFFQHSDPSSALDSGDAQFVDVIHTGGGILGQSVPLGHADFYPNGGSKQPGCDRSSLTCSHNRALIYFAESIDSKIGFQAVSCPSWEDFEANKCNLSSQPETVLMGDPCTLNAKGSYFLKTGSAVPFAIPWWETIK